MNIRLFKSLALLWVLLLVSVSCSRNVLRPKRYPASQVKSAIVATPSPVYRKGQDLIQIVSIDGQPPTFMENKAIVSPGKHRFQVRIEIYHNSARKKERRFVTRADTSIDVPIKAQKFYLIDAEEDSEGLWLWVTDTDTNEIVAGQPPRSKRKSSEN